MPYRIHGYRGVIAATPNDREAREALNLPPFARIDDLDLARRAEILPYLERVAREFASDYRRSRDHLSTSLKQMIERGMQVTAPDYIDAAERIAALNQALDPIFAGYDAILTPSTTGEAPATLETTGNPNFCKIWTLCGVPALTLPILKGPAGLPVGVQLVGRKNDDAWLFRTARWLLESLDH